MAKMLTFAITVLVILHTSNSLPSTAAPQTTNSQTSTTAKNQTTQDKEDLQNLMSQQAENIKKIVADQEEHIRGESPILESKQEPQSKELESMTLEELKSKCQQLYKLLSAANKTQLQQPLVNNNRLVNHKLPETSARPVYVQMKPSYKSKYPTTTKPNGFYVTQPHVSTTKKPVSSSPSTPPIKYIRLEPVILQKTILSDGRTVYYWHRSLPTAVEYSNTQNSNYYQPPQQQIQQIQQIQQLQQQQQQQQQQYQQAYPVPQYASRYPEYPSAGSYYVASPESIGSYTSRYPGQRLVESQDRTQSTSTEPSTTTTTEYSGYGLSNFLPFYSLSRYDSTSSTTTEPTTTTSTTTIKPVTDKLASAEDLMYAQQLKFIIPVPYDSGTNAVRKPWDFDQYAYYPKELQPSTVNVEVPYSPTFHMIRAIALPKVEDKSDEMSINK
nr:unnamed protein product [Callosobruchus chinensis]